MEYTSRKQRQQELREARKQEEAMLHETESTMDNTDTIIMSDDAIFKEQKKRLRRQLNSVPAFTIEAEDMKVTPNTMMTRTEIKKQKKIDEILKDIAVLPENEYLNEDTNLRILKKLSVAKQYNQLQLSPEQEEKMAQNKEKFETITNQLWFLIQELEKRKVEEPAIGTVPTVASTDLERNKSRQFFDLETEKTQAINVADIASEEPEELEMNTKIDILEEKLEKISLRNDELEGVLQELEKVVQEGKEIVQNEAKSSMENVDNVPEDTLELIDYLNKLEELNKTNVMGSMPKVETVESEVEEVAIEEVVIQPVKKDTEDLTEVTLSPINNDTTTIIDTPTATKMEITVDDIDTGLTSVTNSGADEIKQKPTIQPITTEHTTVTTAVENKTTTINSSEANRIKTMEQTKAMMSKTQTTTTPVETKTTTIKKEVTNNPKPKKKDGLQLSIILLSITFIILLVCLVAAAAYFFLFNN